jgi:catechol 2,3-dioxygenase-like lactoylglutathione lyase family enzyme
MPSLENLKKQAKLILRWHRERHYPVATLIRMVLPRFGHLSDPQVLDHSFKLSDAQELVARQSGFASWEALRRGIAAMPDEADRTAPRVVITAAEPQLFVSDIKASCEFFTTKLGFAVAYIYGDPPFSAQVTRDGAALNLRWVDRPMIDAQLREREDLLSAAMTVSTTDEIKLLYLEFQAAGVSFHRALKREPWGARTFIVKDPDGNLLLFAGPAE